MKIDQLLDINPAKMRVVSALLAMGSIAGQYPCYAQGTTQQGVSVSAQSGSEIDWLMLLQGYKVLKQSANSGEFILKQEIQMSLLGRPQGLILHAGAKVRFLASGRVLAVHTLKGNADALIPVGTITYVAIPDPTRNPDDPTGADVLK